MAKGKIIVKGLDEYIKQLNNLNVEVDKVVEKALIETHNVITTDAKKALKQGNESLLFGGRAKGVDLDSLPPTSPLRQSFYDSPRINWVGKIATINVGFDQSKSMHATYLMITGNPFIKPNKELYKAIYGNRKKISNLQHEIFENAILEAMK